jgi:hypothetical protein
MAGHRHSLRALTGVGVLTAALGVGLLAPVAASAAPTSARAAAVAAPTVVRTAAVPTLRVGSTGARVVWVQRVLGVKPTGYFGKRTRAAVVRFQRSRHLAVTGKVNAKTWLALKRLVAARAAARLKARATVPTTDRTMTAAARASRAARTAVPLSVWVSSPHARLIVRRESSGRCTAVSRGGTYRGKWQMNAGFWRSYGGATFAATADKATCAQQDLVAYHGWLAVWWRPWGG